MDFSKQEHRLKEAGVSVHLICTGAGAGLQDTLWNIPGASSFLSGAAFPYSPAETDRLIGFTPKQYCSEDTAIDLASQAYMRAFSFGGKKPVGLGLTASVTSDRPHRGDHRVHICVITDTAVLGYSTVIQKHAEGDPQARYRDGCLCNGLSYILLMEAIFGSMPELKAEGADWTQKAVERFYAHPYFTTEGQRLVGAPKRKVLMPGAYNPPHEGHHGVAAAVEAVADLPVIYTVTADNPHKGQLSVQDLLKRARMLRGKNRLFTRGDPLYIDKARMFLDTPIAMGADALERMLDPKWGADPAKMLYEFAQLGTRFYVSARPVNGRVLTLGEVLSATPYDADLLSELFFEVPGVWDASSTEVRAKIQQA